MRFDELDAPLRLEHPDPDLLLVGAEMEEEVIELARDPEGPELRAGRVNRLQGGRRWRGRALHGDLGHPARAIDDARDRAVADSITVDRARERR